MCPFPGSVQLPEIVGGCFYSLSLIFVFSLAHYIIVMEVI